MHEDADQAAASSQSVSTTGTARSNRLLPTNRLETFSDGVFAIAITLLVLQLDVPPAKGLLGELARQWPAYLGYFVSFAFIGGVWITHSSALRFIKSVDGALMRLNLLLLLFVSLLPFTTALMATHVEGAGERVGVVLFGINLTLAAIMVSVLIGYAAREEEFAQDDVAEEELQEFEKDHRTNLIVLVIATLGGLLLPMLAMFAYFVISLFLLIEPLWRARQRGRRAGKAR